jgi:predicted RNase H-like nuclease (RuvC/YqgF family)
MNSIGNSNTRKNKNTDKELRNKINDYNERIEVLKNEIEEYKKNAVKLSREHQKSRAYNKMRMYKAKEDQIKTINMIIDNLKVKLMNGGKKKNKNKNNNNNFSFNNPLHHSSKSKRKTLKRSNGIRNLYSLYNSVNGKLKRDLQLPINATNQELIDKMMED